MRSPPPTCSPSNRRPWPRPGPVSTACATLASVTDVDPSTPVPGQSPAPAFTADDLVRLTGGRLLARSDRPIRGAAVDSRLVDPGEVFVALPGERTDGHAYLADAVAQGAAALVVDPPGQRPVAARRRDGRPGRGAAGRARGAGRRLASPVRSAGRRGDREHRQDLDQGGDRRRPRPPLSHAAQRGQPEQRGRPAADAAPARAGARGGRPRDGDVRRRRDRRAGAHRPAADRRGDRGPAGPPVADRIARGDRGGQGRAARGAPARRRRDPQRRRPDRPPDGLAVRGARRSATGSPTTPTSAPRRSARPVSTGCASRSAPRARAGR